MAKIKIAGTALVAAALVAGCSKNETTDVATDAAPDVAAAPAEDPNEVMVSVGEKNLTRGEIDKIVNAALATATRSPPSSSPTRSA